MRGPDILLRVGELSRLCGVSTHVLRVWEQRYGLLTPVRSSNGYRLYSRDDVERVQRVVALREQGMAVSSAVREVLASERAKPTEPSEPSQSPVVAELLSALQNFDEEKLHALLDERLRTDPFEQVLIHDLVPFLREVGAGWERSEFTVAHEHFATDLIRRRLAVYAMCWANGSGPRAVLACPPAEHHELLLFAFGVVLGRRGWQVRYLGANTPVTSIREVIQPGDVVLVSASRRVVLIDVLDELSGLAATHQVAIAGAGADIATADRIGATALPNDLLRAADAMGDLAPKSAEN